MPHGLGSHKNSNIPLAIHKTASQNTPPSSKSSFYLCVCMLKKSSFRSRIKGHPVLPTESTIRIEGIGTVELDSALR
jgi:hypothetical protein